MKKIDLGTLTIRAAADALREGRCTSVELVGTLLEAVRRRNPALNAYLWIDEDDALSQAAAADAARAAGRTGALLGVPLAIKDNISVAGQPCGCASRILDGYRAPFDATVIGRLRAAGALFVGRTNMDEFALGSTTESSAHGPAFHPARPGYVPGGSSGGSAAAVAGELALGALGSDTGGSIRQPAAFCGCVGVKPSYGRLSRFGAVACASSLDQIGPMTRDVRDAALLLGIMAGADPRDATCLDQPVPDYVAACEGGVRGLRLGLPREYFVEGMHPEVAARVREAAERCREMGAEVVEVSLPHTAYAVATYYILMTAEVSANLARYDGIRYGRRAEGVATTRDLYCRTRARLLGSEVKRRILLGTYVLSSGYYDAYYLRGLKARTLIRRDFEQVFTTCDALLAPVAPQPAFPCGTGRDDPLALYLGDIYTVPASLAGVCAVSVPAGATAAGLPVGLQVLGPAFAEGRVLRIAAACETAGRRAERPPVNYEVTIGLEVHVQLKTRSKMFCGCATQAGAEPNTQICPVCLGYPGTLPALNREAVRLGAMAGMLLDCEIARVSKFDRKSYFYPDVSKNYQITQYPFPICLGGHLDVTEGGRTRRIGITRIHLEEDVAKSIHHANFSGVDFNRCGVPLMELVTEPELTTPAEALAFLQALRQLLVYADVGECNLELGNMRCDANISLRPAGQARLGTKIEIKNLNTFKGVQAALDYEIGRQAAVLGGGGRISQQTRRWDADAGVTEPMRSKEDAHDYRYFPDPDLLPVVLAAEQIEAWRAALPERPAARRQRMMAEYGIPEYDAGVLAAERPVADFFEAVARGCGNGKAASNWIMTEVLRLLAEGGRTLDTCALTAAALAEIITLVGNGTVNQPTAKALLAEIFEQGGGAAERIAARGLAQVGDRAAIADWVRQTLEANPGPVADFRAGKQAAAGFLVGQVMKRSRGKADPRLAGQEVARQLAGSGA